MRKVRKMVVMLLMVFGAVSVSFGDIGYGNIDMLKAEMKKFEAYYLEKGWDVAEIDCENNKFHFYCEAKVGLLLLEESKAKNIDYFSYDMAKFIWGDERFEDYRDAGYGGKLDIRFGGIKRDFKSFWEKRGLRDAKSKAWKGMAEGVE